jgi:hypothetical protein
MTFYILWLGHVHHLERAQSPAGGGIEVGVVRHFFYFAPRPGLTGRHTFNNQVVQCPLHFLIFYAKTMPNNFTSVEDLLGECLTLCSLCCILMESRVLQVCWKRVPPISFAVIYDLAQRTLRVRCKSKHLHCRLRKPRRNAQNDTTKYAIKCRRKFRGKRISLTHCRSFSFHEPICRQPRSACRS